MGAAIKLFLYFIICILVNYLSLRLSNSAGVVFFWPGNVLAAVLAIRWRSRSRYGRHIRHGGFVLLLILGQFLVSVIENKPQDFSTLSISASQTRHT